MWKSQVLAEHAKSMAGDSEKSVPSLLLFCLVYILQFAVIYIHTQVKKY